MFVLPWHCGTQSTVLLPLTWLHMHDRYIEASWALRIDYIYYSAPLSAMIPVRCS